MDPVTGGLLLTAGTSIFKGFTGFQQGKAEQQRADIGAFNVETKSVQDDTSARLGIENELAQVRNQFGSGGGVAGFDVLNEVRRLSDRQRRIGASGQTQRAEDMKFQGRLAGYGAQNKLIGGVLGAGQSIFTIAKNRNKAVE